MGVNVGVLGSLEVWSDGAEVRVGAPKLRALLAALVVDVGRVVPAERLVDDLWGEDATPQAMVSLRSYVSNLRRLLPTDDDRPVIVTRGPGYALDLDPDAVDAVRFERLARQGRDRLAAGDARAAVEAFDEALALWRGPALVDVAEMAFARATIARLDELRLTTVEDRLDALLAAGRSAEVVAEAEAHTADHPLRERPRGQLMRALYLTGRAPDALAVHRAFRTTLADELGLDPSDQLDALADAILRRDPALDPPQPPTAIAAPAPPAVGGPPKAAGPSTDALVGRVLEQGRLAEATARLADGRGGVVLLAGDPGIGKTALLRHLDDLATGAAVPVVWGRCPEAAGVPAFWPWVQVLRAVVASLDDAALTRLTAGAAAPVGQLVPEVADRTGRAGAVTAMDPHAARFALHDAVTTFLERAAEDRGLVVVLDDLHWGDLATLELLGFLGAHARTARILVAASYRDTEADRTPDLDAALATLAREDTTTTLALAGLSRDDVAQLTELVGGQPVDAAVTDEIHRRAGGNPFFVRQLAQLRVESGEDTDTVPVGVRHVLLRRLGLVPAEVRATLDMGSILGQDLDARVLATMRDLPLGVVLDQLDVAADHGLVEGTGGATGWRFVHALIRDTLQGELSPSRVVRLHAAAAEALEQHPVPPVQAIADHLWHAADLVELERPVAWLRAAATEALVVHAHEQAEHHLRRALHLLAHDPTAAPRLELAVRLQLVPVLIGLYGWSAEDIVEVAGRARELAGTTGIGPELTWLWWPLWSTWMTRGELSEAQQMAHQLLAGVAEVELPAAKVAGQLAVAYSELFLGVDVDTVLGRLRTAREHEAAADPDTLGMTSEHLGVAIRITEALAHALRGEAEPALAAVDEAVAVARTADRPFSEAYARMFGGFASAVLDRPEEARAHGDAGLAICDRLGLDHLANLTIPAHGWACARLGGDADAEVARVGVAIDGLATTGHHHALAQWMLLHAEIRALAGDDDGARDTLAAARALADRIGECVYGPQLARVEAGLGRSVR